MLPRERVWHSFDIEQLSTLYQNLYAYNEMGKTKTRQDTESESTSVSVSGSGSDDIRAAVMETMTDPTILAMLAERVADAVFAKFEKRMSAFESELQVKDKRIELLEKSVYRMEGQIDAQEQYSRRTSVRISGVDEASGGEDVGRIVSTIIEK